MDNVVTLEDDDENSNDENSDSDDDDDDNDDSADTNRNMFTISTGNTGLVLVTQMIDYINRGDTLSDMSLYEYCSKVFKTRFTDEDKEKYFNELERMDYEERNPTHKRKPGPKPIKKLFFLNEHPQSETHWQKLRTEGLIPALSKLPSNPNTCEEKYQKCMLLLFKPFCCFTDLYNGISWNDSYETYDFGRMSKYIENIREMHIGLDEKEERRNNNDENTDDKVNDYSDELDDDEEPIESIQVDMHEKTTEALDIIRNSTDWLQESTSEQPTMLPAFISDNQLPPARVWKNEIKKQNADKRNNEDTIEDQVEQRIPSVGQLMTTFNDQDVAFTVQPSDEKDLDEIADDIITEYSLNRKQKFAFKLAIRNVIKRERKEETRQIIAYIGGPGGTGKSQVIKAIVAFHEREDKTKAYTQIDSKYWHCSKDYWR